MRTLAGNFLLVSVASCIVVAYVAGFAAEKAFEYASKKLGGAR